MTARTITIDTGLNVCINCAFFAQYWTEDKERPYLYHPTSTGFCRKHNGQRGALQLSCREFDEQGA